MSHAYQHEDEMETEHMEQIKMLCAERDELARLLTFVIGHSNAKALLSEAFIDDARLAVARARP